MIDGDNGIQRHAHDGAFSGFVFAQGVPDLFAFGDIFGDADHPVDFAGFVLNGKSAVLNPAHGVVRTYNAIDFIVFAGNLFGVRRFDDAGAVFRMNGVDPVMGRGIEAGDGAAPDFFIGWADIDHLVFGDIGHPENFADV